MKKEDDQWVEEIFLSAIQKKDIHPNPELFAKIEANIDKITPIRLWKFMAAAAVLLLLVNLVALKTAYSSSQSDPYSIEESFTSSMPIQSNYKLYD